MTPLKKKIHRRTNGELGGQFGIDRGKRIVVTLIPGNPMKQIPDMIQLRPEKTRRGETLALEDLYGMAVRMRVNRSRLVKAREAKARKKIRRERNALKRREKNLLK